MRLIEEEEFKDEEMRMKMTPSPESTSNTSIMITQAPIFPVSKASFQRQSSYNSHLTKQTSPTPLDLQRRSSCDNHVKKRNSSTSTSHCKNRLGPYSTTHPSAQIKALEMLNLKPSDVFFDLGCSDGRLLVMALESAIDEEIEERRKQFLGKATSRGVTWERNRCDEKNEECLLGECLHVKRRNSQTLQYCFSDPSVPCRSRLDSTEVHRRNQSFDSFAMPHLMRNSSDDSQFDDILDGLSTDDFEAANQRQESWNSFLTPRDSDMQDDRSPITPLISNRKVFKNESTTKHIEPLPSKKAGQGLAYINQDATKIRGLDTVHLVNIFDDDVQSTSTHAEGLKDYNPTEYLRCIGIELDESLVDRAKSIVERALSKYPNESLSERIFIRYGDILDEWVRDYDADVIKNTEHLTLLNDCTACFIYLSPEGLKKVKPLLVEAAARRRRTKHEVGKLKYHDGSHQFQLKDPGQKMQVPEVIDELELLEAEEFIPLDTVSQGHQSRLSDITYCDSDWERCRTNSDSFDQGKDDHIPKWFVGSPLTTNMLSASSSFVTNSSQYTTPFRVVSYMHPIPGWKSTKIDRSSCGSCPLYYYEDIDFQHNN